MAPRRRCPTCGSKQWHKEPSSGMIACSEGHVLQNYRNETTEITEVGPHAMKKRTLKSGRKVKGQSSNADPKLYHGARGRYHYFQCLQLILRKQIAALTTLWELPPEFEVICRDIWALNLALLPDPPPAEPYHHAQENRAGDPSAKDGQESDSPLNAKPNSEDHGLGGPGEEEQDNAEKEGESLDEDEEENSELEALMRENSEISSSSDDERGDVPNAGAGLRYRKARGRFAYESPMSTIAVLVVACWTMRIPILYCDFTRIIESYELPYLDAVMQLPRSMAQHLTKHNVRALSPPQAPRTMGVHSLASRLAKKLWTDYGIYTPEANGASMLWRITKYMGGTPLLYRLTKRVASVLSVPMTLHASLAPELAKGKRSNAKGHRHDNAPSEVGLLASLIMVVKMVYGLDGTARRPSENEDVAWGLVTAKEYLGLIDRQDGLEARFDSRKRLNVGDMTEEEMDEYISFCAKILVGAGTGETERLIRAADGDGAVSDYFGGNGEGHLGVAEEQEERVRLGGVEEGTGLGAGEEYKIWSARDVDGAVPEALDRVLGRAARVAGLRAEYLVGVLETFERRLVKGLAGNAEGDDK